MNTAEARQRQTNPRNADELKEERSKTIKLYGSSLHL